MTFDERFPDMFRSVEEKLKKQVKDKELDYDTVKKDTDNGIIFGDTYYGVIRFGQKYALKMTLRDPEFIDYKDIFWAFGAKGGEQKEYDCIGIVFHDGHDVSVILNDKKDEQPVLDRIAKANPDTLIGRTDENREKYKALLEKVKPEKLKPKEEPPQKPTVPDPVAKLPQNKVDSMHRKIEQIISMSKKLAETDKKCYIEFSEPLDEKGKNKIVEWCKENGAYLPEPYMILLSHADRFLVDFDPIKVGYFAFSGFDTDRTPSENCGNTKEALLAREYDYYIKSRAWFGTFAYQSLEYNPYTGEMYIDRGGGFRWDEKFIPIKDFEKDILDKVIDYLEKNERKGKLLKDSAKNPMRKYYDRLLGYIDDCDDPDLAVFAPLTKKEITAWEKAHNIKLPRDYKNWLMLSDGGEFADKSICKLDELDTENPAIDPESGKGYIIIAGLSNSSDCLVFDPRTNEQFVLTDDGKRRTGDFIVHVFQEGFEYLDENADED